MKDEKNNTSCEQEQYFVSNSAVDGRIKNKLNMLFHMVYSKEAYKKMKDLLNHEKPNLVILNLVHKQITLSIIDAIKEYNVNLPIFWVMHDLITICPSYTMVDGKGNICEKCLTGDFSTCVKTRCIKGSLLMSILSKYEAEYIRKRKWYDKIDLYICPSEFYRKKLSEAKFTRRPIVTLRNPLPENVYHQFSASPQDYLLYFGRLSREKGVKTLIDAIKETRNQLFILGTGPMEEQLKEYAKDFANIEFKGFQSGDVLIEYIEKCRCVVLPSEWYENGPYSVMEAMAMGKPLIVSNQGGLPELVEDGYNGYIFDIADGSKGLTNCINKLMSLSAQEYIQLAENSYEKAKTMFNAKNYVQEIERYAREVTTCLQDKKS